MEADTDAVTVTQHESRCLDGILYHHELTPVKGSVAKALQRMIAAGFSVQVVAGRLRVSPADRLTPVQRQWIAANKAALVAALVADSGHVAEIVKTFDATVMRVTPDTAAHPPVSVGLPESTDTGGVIRSGLRRLWPGRFAVWIVATVAAHYPAMNSLPGGYAKPVKAVISRWQGIAVQPSRRRYEKATSGVSRHRASPG